VDDVKIAIGLGLFDLSCRTLGPNRKAKCFVSFFSKKIRLKSASSELLISYLAFVIRKL